MGGIGGGTAMTPFRNILTAFAAIAAVWGPGSSTRAQSAAQLRQWQDWCDGRNGTTAEQTATGCVNLMQSEHAPSVPPPPPVPVHNATTRTRPHPVNTQPAQAAGPSLDDNASATDFLQAARGAVAAGRLAEAKDALEHAESRVLTRSETIPAALKPSKQQPVQQIADARAALDSGDRMRTLGLIDLAINTTDTAQPAQ
jgi:hypothetical protein